MTGQAAAIAYEQLTFDLRDEDGVTVVENELFVHGTIFAFLEDDDLVVELSEARAADLKSRGVAEVFVADQHPTRNWVRVSDRELWPELARESHDFAGEPAVGGES
jgi:hypothetical protein